MSLVGMKSQRSAIGVELDQHEFRAVQLIQEGDTKRVHAWAVFPRLSAEHVAQDSAYGHPGEEEMKWAMAILGRRGFKGTAISSAPQTRDCGQHVFELPPPESGAPLEQLARLEVARARKCEPNAFEFGFWDLPQRGRTNESMAVACASDAIKSMMQAYEAGGMSVAGIDIPELAIMRGVLDTPSIGIVTPQPEINAVLLVNWFSSLAIVTLGHRIVYVRRIAHGARRVWEHATSRFGLSERSAREVFNQEYTGEHAEQIERVCSACWAALSKDLASELDVAIAYVSHSFRMAPLGKIVMSGYGSMNPTLLSRFDSVLGIPVVSSAPKALVDVMSDQHDGSLPARLTYAYGLAARFDS